jgi:hypothetical protein
VIASALTFVALPGIWLVNRDDEASARPNVAAVGAAVDGGSASPSIATFDPMGTAAPQYLDGSATPGASSTVPAPPAVGTVGEQVVATARAIFRRSVRDDRTCLFNGVEPGTRVVVVNVENDLSIACYVSQRDPDQPEGELVMSARSFAEIADPTAAPIAVEIRQ